MVLTRQLVHGRCACLVAGVCLTACAAPTTAATSSPPPKASQPVESPPKLAPKAPQTSVPTISGILLFNPTDAEITPYRGYIVAVDGSSGTRQLWPSAYECRDTAPVFPALGRHDGRLTLEPPTVSYGGSGCESAPLPAGQYVVRIDSGHGADLFATDTIDVPMTGPIQMRFENRSEEPWPCDPVRARRAATLAVEAAQLRQPLPEGFLAGCDLNRAQCGATAEQAALPPDRCSVTLSDGWLRIDRVAGNDALRGLVAHVDREATNAQMAAVTRTSASVVQVSGKPVRIAGRTSHEIHQHGGEAATVYGVVLEVDNPVPLPLGYKITGVEFLIDYQCGLPQKVFRRPKVTAATPPRILPGRSTLEVQFEGQEAYQGHCDRFATRVRLEVAGQPITVTSEHEVSRFDPI